MQVYPMFHNSCDSEDLKLFKINTVCELHEAEDSLL